MTKQGGLGGGGSRRTPAPEALSSKVRSRLADQFQTPADLDTAEAILPRLRDELSKETRRPQELRERVAARVSKASADAAWLTDSAPGAQAQGAGGAACRAAWSGPGCE